MPRAATIKELAKAAGLSASGTSYALRGNSRISPETVARVRRLAEELGYKPDLRVASVMARIRSTRQKRDRETLAFVWVSTPPPAQLPSYHEHYLKTIVAGARRRADQLGCTLAEFRLDEPGMTPARLAQVLRTRAITGVVFSPAMRDLAVAIDWKWEEFASAVIGNTEWSPALHRAGHHHYRSMWRTLERLRGEGFKRPAALLSRSIQQRVHGVHQAAFQVNHPAPAEAPELTQFGTPDDHAALKPWPRRLAPDALIVGWPVDRATERALRRLVPTAQRMVTLDWQPAGALPGIDVCNDEIAASAVDVVVAQLHRNERGVPPHPTSLLLDGVWREEVGER
jgi:LacI family transcriptional regulator